LNRRMKAPVGGVRNYESNTGCRMSSLNGEKKSHKNNVGVKESEGSRNQQFESKYREVIGKGKDHEQLLPFWDFPERVGKEQGKWERVNMLNWESGPK